MVGAFSMHLAAERRESEGRDRHLPRLILRKIYLLNK